MNALETETFFGCALCGAEPGEPCRCYDDIAREEIRLQDEDVVNELLGNNLPGNEDYLD